MADEVTAEVEIDGRQIPHYNDIFLRQHFNQHHEFSIKINHDVLETFGSFALNNSKNLIGKSAVIKFYRVSLSARQLAYEFAGIITEIGMVQSNSASGDLLIKGYSPTILLEDGPRFASFNDKNLKDIVTQSIQAGLSKTNALDHIEPQYTSPIKYICQYKESTFHFINRLSSVYGELFYYDGSTVIFGQPQTIEMVEVVYGEDMNDMQLNLHVEPIEVWESGYASEGDSLFTSRGDELSGLDEYANHVVQVSNNLYSDLDNIPLLQRVKNVNEATTLVNKRKESIAAGLVVLSGSTNNPNIFIGCAADVKISRRNGNSFTREDYGTYLVTSVTHHITGTGKYYNTFKSLSGWVKGIPVYNAVMPTAETQMGWIVDNKDPDKMGRVRVQMLWQEPDEKTDWIWVMAPDAGGGKNGARGGGLTVLPQHGDRVLVGFVHNNPDRPFVYGSLYHGKTAPDGSVRCLSARKTAAHVCINDADGSVEIADDHSNYIILKEDGIWVQAHENIHLFVFGHSARIDLSNDDINISGKNITIHASEKLTLTGDTSATMKKDDNTYFKAEGSKADIHGNSKVSVGGPGIELNADTNLELKSGGTALLQGSGKTSVNGAPVDLNQ